MPEPPAGVRQRRAEVPTSLDGERIDRALPRLLPELSRSRARRILGEGGVHLGRKRCRVASRPVRRGDKLTVTWRDDRPADGYAPSAPQEGTASEPDGAGTTLRVRYADPRLLIVSKPPGQHVQGTELGDAGTVIREARALYGEGVRLVHRIDAPASGLLVLARDPGALARLQARFREHDVERRYLAVTAAEPPEGPCRIPLCSEGRRMRPASSDERGARSAHTDLEILERRRPRALVRASLQTGRTHQVRLHLAALGAPVVGDRTYGGPRAKRLCLHAVRLAFVHPGTGQWICFEERPDEAFHEAAGWRVEPFPDEVRGTDASSEEPG